MYSDGRFNGDTASESDLDSHRAMSRNLSMGRQELQIVHGFIWGGVSISVRDIRPSRHIAATLQLSADKIQHAQQHPVLDSAPLAPLHRPSVPLP